MKKVTFLLVSMVVSICSFAGTKAEESMKAMVNRLFPQHAEAFVFEQTNQDGADTYTIESKEGKIIIKGNSPQAMAVGLNYYLKYSCHTTVAWTATNKIKMPDVLPATKKITSSARVENRFFLNYCTYGYTMPWWTWKDWERFIDWMALNGINLPLANTGMEQIAYNVYKKVGMSDEDIRSFFTGPAHLPWHRMSNIDKWQGPLPMSWIKGQAELQKKIVARERELGMKPILPGFSGHVPGALRNIYPNAKITKLNNWAGFRDSTSCYFLDPSDPLFAEIQHEYIRQVIDNYGTDHIYGIDPFNEMKLPSEDPAYLAGVAKGIFGTLTDIDKEATWLQMTWMFYYDRGTWTPERIKAFLGAIPQGKLILLDYWAEFQEVWRRTEQYYGQPYIWCYLGNFGGNTGYNGDIKNVSTRLEGTFKEGGKNFSGLGGTLEGFDINPFIHEYFFEKAWTGYPGDEEFVKALADRHVGMEDAKFEQAWKELMENIYLSPKYSGSPNSITGYPQLKSGEPLKTDPSIVKDNLTALNIWKLMVESKKLTNDVAMYDAVNIGREVIGTYFYSLRNQFTQECAKGDVKAAKATSKKMLETMDDLNTLLAQHEDFSFYKWVDDARTWGATAEEKDYMEINARTLLTTWGFRGHSLRDYAKRAWAGLMSNFYKKRWEIFITNSLEAATKGEKLDEAKVRQQIFDFEWDFAERRAETTLQRPTINPVKVINKMYNKYSKLVLQESLN